MLCIIVPGILKQECKKCTGRDFSRFSPQPSWLPRPRHRLCRKAFTDDRTNFTHILSKPEDFYGATPYTYWFAALLILVFGPGRFALDSLIEHWFLPCRDD